MTARRALLICPSFLRNHRNLFCQKRYPVNLNRRKITLNTKNVGYHQLKRSNNNEDLVSSSGFAFRVASCQRMLSSRKVGSGSSNSNDVFSLMGLLSARVMSALSIIYIINEYGLDWTLCEGPSMKPTISPKGDIIVMERWSHRIYGLDGGDVGSVRAAAFVSDKCLPNVKSLWTQFFRTGIHVGDVIVCQHPQKESTVCKRILGLPGDTVLLSRSRHHDSNQMKELFVNENSSKKNHQSSSHHAKWMQSSSLIVVPDGHVWIEGDNAINSSDSRHYGPVPAHLILGKVICRFWPHYTQMRRMWRPKSKFSNHSGSIVLPAGYSGEEELSPSYYYGENYMNVNDGKKNEANGDSNK